MFQVFYFYFNKTHWSFHPVSLFKILKSLNWLDFCYVCHFVALLEIGGVLQKEICMINFFLKDTKLFIDVEKRLMLKIRKENENEDK